MFIVICTIILITILVVLFIRQPEHSSYLSDEVIKNVPDKFEELYNKLYYENTEVFEKMRKNVKRNIYINLGLWLLFIAIFCYYFLQVAVGSFESKNIFVRLEYGATKIMLFISFIASVIVYCGVCNAKDKYKSEYKNVIVKQFVKLFNNNLEYMPKLTDENYKKIVVSYKEADFTNLSRNIRITPEDHIFGQIDDFKIDFVDIKTSYIGDRKKETRIEKATSFLGSFCTITLPNKVDNDIRIVSDKIPQGYIDNFIKYGYQYIPMDNQSFEHKFNVYAKDNISAMMLLTHDVMESLLDFCDMCFLDFDIIIKDNHIYMRICTGNLFEPVINKKGIDKEHLLTQYCILALIVKFSKLLNNTLKQ